VLHIERSAGVEIVEAIDVLAAGDEKFAQVGS
jgi:hypothetical protein